MQESVTATEAVKEDGEGIDLLDLAVVLAENLKLLIIGPLVIGLAALGITYLITPTFTARTTFLPPQQQQSATAQALASLGALAGLAGSAGAIKSPADQYLSLMRSTSVQDRLIDRFMLMDVYGANYRFQARQKLEGNVRMDLGKRDGLISVEVDDTDPRRAADLANAFVDELRLVISQLAVTEAQQRRLFFEQQLERSKERMTKAQQALQTSGFTQGALKTEPKMAADNYARLKADVTAADVKLQTLRSYLSENAPEVQMQAAQLTALRTQLTRAEQSSAPPSDGNYVSAYRDFKYEETLFDLFARQLEAARLDESREGALIQVIDPALVPEWKTKPSRALIAVASAMVTLTFLLLYFFVRAQWLRVNAPPNHERIARIRAALRRS